MNYEEFVKENFDVPTLLEQLNQSKVIIRGIGGLLEICLYGESEEVLTDAADSLHTLANDEDANRGTGVLPETVCGSVEVIERLRAISHDEYALIAFYEDGWGWDGAFNALEKNSMNPLFRLVSEFSEKILIHEHSGKHGVRFSCGEMIARTVWKAQDFIVYQTVNHQDSAAKSTLVLMILKRGVHTPS